MTTAVVLNRVEIVRSEALQADAYSVTFALSDEQGKLYASAAMVANIDPKTQSTVHGILTVQVPLQATSEGQAITKARDILKGALSRMAGVSPMIGA